MENKYIKTDDSIINEKSIRWVKKMNNCLYVCIKTNGCSIRDTHKICKFNSYNSYNKLNKLFEEDKDVILK